MSTLSHVLGARVCARLFRPAQFAIPAITLMIMAASCKKEHSATPAPPPVVRVNATSLSTDIANAGDTVQVKGIGLGTDTSKINIVIFETTIQVRVIQVRDTVASIILPSVAQLGYYGKQFETLQITIGTYTTPLHLNIVCPEPKGWYSVYSSAPAFNYWTYPQANIHLTFPSDSIGYLEGYNIFLKSRDGGITWKAPGTFYPGAPVCMAALDTSTLWIGNTGSPLTTSVDGGNTWQFHTLPSQVNDIAAGVYLSGPATGMIAGVHGEIYTISGGFDTTSAVTLDYKSPNNNGGAIIWNGFSAVDNNNSLAGGSVRDYTVTPSVIRPLVTVKTNGTYDEYYLPSSVSTYLILKVQLLSGTLGFASDAGGNLLKYTGNRNWSVLPLKVGAAWFADASTGYAAGSGQIYKTTDGGQTWTGVFTLQSGEVVYDITGRNGRVWIVGNNTTAGKGFIYKYNP